MAFFIDQITDILEHIEIQKTYCENQDYESFNIIIAM